MLRLHKGKAAKPCFELTDPVPLGAPAKVLEARLQKFSAQDETQEIGMSFTKSGGTHPSLTLPRL
jgi:hypothetical protein